MSYSLRKEEIIQDAASDDGSDGVPALASEGSEYEASDDEGPPPAARASNGASAAARGPAAGGRAAPQTAAAPAAAEAMPALEEDDEDDGPPGLASGDEEGVGSYHSDSEYSASDAESVDSDIEPPALADDDLPQMVSDAEASESDDEPLFSKQAWAQQQRPPAKAATPAAAAAKAGKKGAGKAKKAASPGDDDDDAIPGLLSDAASSAGSSDDEAEVPPLRGQARQAAAAAKPGAPFATGYFGQGAEKKGATPDRSRTTYGGEGAGRREDLRGPRATSTGPARPADQFETAQQQQQQAAAQRARQRKPAPAPAPVVVEKVEAEVAQDEYIREALRLEEEERKALRKKMGLEEDEEAEVEDPVLGPCGYGEQCTKDPEAHAVRTSHANRYEFRCSAGHKLFYHRECWLKATVRWVDLKGQEHEKEGRDFKFNSYKKEHRRSCILPGCGGIVTFIEGPNKYGILNIEEDVSKEQAGKEAEAEELPEWELYTQQERRERRFRFKKGKGKKAADEDEEEEPAPQPPKRGPRPSLDDGTPAAQRERQAPADSAGASAPTAAAAAGEAEEPVNATPALPDDQLLRAFKRESSEDELLGLGKGRKGKDKGKPPAKEVADIVYEDGAGAKKKKGKGVKLVLGAGLSIAEQRRLQHQQAAAGGLEAAEASLRPQRLADSLLEFPDLQEAAQLAKETREEDEERVGRQLYSAALLGELRSHRAEADDLRPDDPHGPSTMFLRSTFAEYGPVKDLRMYEACRAAVVSFRSTASAYKAFVLLSQKTLLHSRLSAIMLRRWPKEQEVEDAAQRKLEEEQRRREEGIWEDEEAAATASLASSAQHEDRPASSASGGRAPLFMEHGRASPAGAASMSITIPGAAQRGGAGAGLGPSGSGGGGAGSMGSSLGNSLKVNAREFVPGSGGFASPGQGVSPPSATAAAAAAAANAAGGLRVAAHEFRPGGPAAAAGAAGAAAAAEDTLLNQFLSGQLIQANTQTLGVYLSQGDEQFGIQTIYMERVGVVSQGQVALLMYNQDTGTLHGVWSAQHKEHANTAQELVAFRRERMLPPLPVAEVQGYLQWQGGAVRLPQKIAAANIKPIMRAFLDLERSQQAIGHAAAAAAAPAAPAPAPAAPAPAPPAAAAQQAQQSQQAQQAQQDGGWWAEQERLRREQEEADAELARQLQEQLLAEDQLAAQRQAEEDARLAAALQTSAPAAPAAAPAAPAAPKHPCVACKERESVHIWIPCGHHGHCQVCLSDDVPKHEKLPRFPACLVCGCKAEYYIRVFN
ncbi:hypothetical protein C2E21_8941 [Chlorella sorokiniana]|uniref:Uncharacterized protein n=1 Tax=Chlorella sorokiniana TaxID=3076 RepID=A0A2P6TD24_CHLSO|nr:hypothetical protein C2E21_8941 [Chlorella sorokiniana]|eukprot:PRW20538.1 hypothetical protein C2E21_8941 [Chlorella sorokiniana]